MSLTFCPCFIFFFTYLFWPGAFRSTHANPLSMEIQSETPVQIVTFISCRMYVSHAISYERNMTNVPPSLSCSSLGVFALETCNRKCPPSFSHLSFFCDMMASCCFEIRRWRGKKKHTSLMWHCKTSKEFATPFDLEVIRWVIVWGGGGVSCWLIHGSSTTVTWPTVINGNPNTLLSSCTCPL